MYAHKNGNLSHTLRTDSALWKLHFYKEKIRHAGKWNIKGQYIFLSYTGSFKNTQKGFTEFDVLITCILFLVQHQDYSFRMGRNMQERKKGKESQDLRQDAEIKICTQTGNNLVRG